VAPLPGADTIDRLGPIRNTLSASNANSCQRPSGRRCCQFLALPFGEPRSPETRHDRRMEYRFAPDRTRQAFPREHCHEETRAEWDPGII